MSVSAGRRIRTACVYKRRKNQFERKRMIRDKERDVTKASRD
tara:strand:+ start:1137 stop:1262 length:126 start_codon:yes stop_codon:yes gene_type:complete